MIINRYNYAAQFENTIDELTNEIKLMLLKGHYVLTDEVFEFEKQYANYIGTEYAKGVNSGTDALIISLIAAGIGPGDEVITQANTFYATVAAIKIVGAKPILIDADDSTYLMDIKQLDAAITSNTKAIIPVHLFGKPSPMEEIIKHAKKHNLVVIEDAAQAHGAKINNKRVGSFGDFGCFSFHPSKNLAAAGDAGIIVTNNKNFDEKIRPLRELGQYKTQYNHTVIGFNSKLDSLQAKILSIKLSFLESWNKRRSEIAKTYRDVLENLPITFQETNEFEEHVYHLFQIRSNSRNELLEFLKNRNIDAVIRYPMPIHLQQAFNDCGWQKGQFPVSEKLSQELLCLPLHQNMIQEEIDYVCDNVKGFFK